MKISSKTPYEIRLELLQLAHSILISKHQADAISKHKIGHEILPGPCTSPTSEEIIAEADKLNIFVSNTVH